MRRLKSPHRKCAVSLREFLVQLAFVGATDRSELDQLKQLAKQKPFGAKASHR